MVVKRNKHQTKISSKKENRMNQNPVDKETSINIKTIYQTRKTTNLKNLTKRKGSQRKSIKKENERNQTRIDKKSKH
jgi:hypothetical protein